MFALLFLSWIRRWTCWRIRRRTSWRSISLHWRSRSKYNRLNLRLTRRNRRLNNHNSPSSISTVFQLTYKFAKIGIAYTTTMFSILPKIKNERQKNDWKHKAASEQT
uniref:Secreted protein n=1 Tax=Meloidogyne incognita TaxID=6306 RepID=A0A914LE91_MELIC